MTARPRLAVVEDTDPAIQYTGPWFQNYGTHDNLGDIGTPSQDTLHGVNANASFSFTFSGSEVTLYGTIDAPTTSSSGITDLSWACSVDGVSISSFDTSSPPGNNLALCGSSLLDAMHTIVLQAIVLNPSKTFWFDELQYAPLTSVPLDNATIIVDHSDPAIQYGSGWETINGGVTTQLTETGLSLDFVGVHLSLFGIPANTSGTLTRGADFSVDAVAPVSVPLPTALGNFTVFNQLIFQTEQLTPGKHRLEVTHYLSTTPLSLQYFIIQNTTIPSLSFNLNSTSKSKSSTGAIAAGVTVSIVIIAGLIFLLVFLRRRAEKRQKVLPYITPDLATSLHSVDPFNVSLTATAIDERRRIPHIYPPFKTTRKVTRGDYNPDAATVVSTSDANTSPVYSSSHPSTVIRHEDSGVRLSEREELVVELPPLYTSG